MSTLYWNPQVEDFTSTDDDDVVLSWGIGSFETLHAKTLSVEGGVNVTIGTTTAQSLVVDNGTIVTITSEQAASFKSITVDGGGILRIAGDVTTQSLTIGNGSQVFMDGGLSVDKFSITGGSILNVTGYMSVNGHEIKKEGDVSYIWNTEMSSGSIVIHQHGTDACFLPGTEILTNRGMCYVEDICVGDYVITYDENGRGVPKAVVWTGCGSHTVDKRYATGRSDISGVPVCITADAFGTGRPYRDLYVTPEHMIYIDGKGFIPVRLLVDDRAIYYASRNLEYDYYHFAFEKHEIVSANGLLTESYLATDGHVFSTETCGELPSEMTLCRPLLASDLKAVEDTRNAIMLRGYHKVPEHKEEGTVSLRSPGFVAAYPSGDCRPLTPLRKTNKCVTYSTFNLKAASLFFNTTRPCDENPASDDRREVGPDVDIIGITPQGKIVPMTEMQLEGMHDFGRPSECVTFPTGHLAQFVVSLRD